MKVLYHLVFLLATATALPVSAQQAPAPAADTTGREEYVGGKDDRYYWGTLTKADGTQLQAYLPCKSAGYEDRISYFLPPLSISNELRHRHGLNLKEVKTMTVHGRLYENIELAGKPTDVLALHLFDGPISLSTYVEPRSIPIPIPLGVGMGGPVIGISISDKNHWYLRRNGVWTEMRRANFAERMSAYLFDNPELAGKVARQEPNYLHPDTPAIIAAYNRSKADIK